jgi:hypothetical protein
VLIYFGTGNPAAFYSTENTATLPGQISYGSIVVGPPDGGDYMSHGDVAVAKYDRPYAYVGEGELVSSMAYFKDGKPAWTELEYLAEVPEGAKAVLVLESSSEGENWAEGGRVQLESGQRNLKLAKAGIKLGPYTRYRLLLTSANGTAAPTIKKIHFLQS